MERFNLLIKFDSSIIGTTNDRGKEIETPAQLELNKVWDGKTSNECDIIEKRLYIADNAGNENVCISRISAYDIWEKISIAEEGVQSEEAFLSGPYNSKRAVNTTILSNIFLSADTDSSRLFKFLPKKGLGYKIIECREKLLTGTMELMIQSYKPYPSGHRDVDKFLAKVTLDSELESQEGYIVESGTVLMFRIPFKSIGWLNTHKKIQDDNGCPWEAVATPLPIIFNKINN